MKTAREIEFAAEFQRRRRRWLSIVGPCGALMLAGVCIRFIDPTLTRWGMYAAIAAMIGWFVAVYLARYRCPRCEKVPNGPEGTLLNPAACPTCGLEFR